MITTKTYQAIFLFVLFLTCGYRHGAVWRFPAWAAFYGGRAFFIPYLMALFIIGLPVLFLEIALGQYYQSGDIGVCKCIH